MYDLPVMSILILAWVGLLAFVWFGLIAYWRGKRRLWLAERNLDREEREFLRSWHQREADRLLKEMRGTYVRAR